MKRSDRTKAAILVAARERFAADGYAKATIRAIAAQADIDPSMVMRYFGSKEKLLAAAASFELELPDLTAIRPDSWGDVLARHLVARWERNDTLVALLRVAATQDFAAERMRTLFAGQVAPLVARIEPDEKTAATRAGLLATQMLGLALTRYVLELPPVVALTTDELAAWLSPVLQHYLTGMVPGSDSKE
ncbi:TetR family transcriptional regulator [Actinoplanes sp. NPDC051343]|uniref:TetR/AcrR family transcriptional regulator n=1 Tax=Actinoplanes sp. NPDC051343 TaxID=3363906 RepID=UPI00379E8AA4